MSFFSKTVWFLKGLKEYTKGGYEAAAKNFNLNDLVNSDVHGASYMITGANSGIGKVAALEIAKCGGTVHLVCRNKERGEAAASEIKQLANNESVFLHVVDLAKPVDVHKFTTNFVKGQNKLDVLINNAGCMNHERKLDTFGFESNFATNTLAVHILTKGLLPLIEQSSDPRVIMVSSGGMLTEKLKVADLQSEKMKPFDGTSAYAQQKRQQVIMTEMYAQQSPNVKFSSMHPGWADTIAVQQSMPSFHARMKNKLRTAEQGADTIVWLALSPSAKSIPSGKFFQDRKPVATHLPLSWTQASDADRNQLMNSLDDMLKQVKDTAGDS
ncbi:DHRS12 [Bugula neritina]|uniref:DHRS12 n=1 Tax=Bugula neritina TaxID=10212 RepID=A0A7J7JZ83_BUGNE|nr:DHRS12 [Bugula neritina]